MNIFFNLIITILIICFFATWGYAIYDVVSTKFKSKNLKLIWTLLLFLLPISAIYYFLFKRKYI